MPPRDEIKRVKRIVAVSTSTYIPLPAISKDAFLTCEEHDSGSIYHIDEDVWILAYDSQIGGSRVTTTMKVSPVGLSITTIGDSHHRLTLPHDDIGAYHTFHGGMSVRMNAELLELSYELPTIERADGYILFRYRLWSCEDDTMPFEFGRAINLS